MIGTATYAINDGISSCDHHHHHELSRDFGRLMTVPQSLPHHRSKIADKISLSPSFPSGKKSPEPSNPHVSTKTLPIKKRRLLSSKCTVRPTKHALAIKPTNRSLNDGRRRVRFQHDRVSNRIVRKAIYGRVTMTEEEKKALWWDTELKKSARRAIRMYRQGDVYDGPSMEEFERRYNLALALCSSECASMEDIPMLSDTPMRGLEQKLFPKTVQTRQDAVRKVVAAQHKLPKQLAPEQQSKLLRSVSQNLTRSSRMMARLYGIGDATVAALDDI